MWNVVIDRISCCVGRIKIIRTIIRIMENSPMNMSSKLCAVALLAASTWSLSAPAGAAPITAPWSMQNVTSSVETVQFRRWGWGVGAGIAAGLIVGGAIAASQYPYYGYGYGPYPYGYYAPG